MNRSFLGCVLVFTGSLWAQDFPLREKYPDVKPVTTQDLIKNYATTEIVDVRSELEFDVIHIVKAKHFDMAKATFKGDLVAAFPNKNAVIAFYCNGPACYKSYEAVKIAVGEGYVNVAVYDAGPEDLLKTDGTKVVLMGKSPVTVADLISKDKFKEKLLESAEFSAGCKAGNAMLIDVREPVQKKKPSNLATGAVAMPLDKLIKNLSSEQFRKSTEGKTFYIFDYIGKQVEWLQYHLKKHGYENYFFLKDGVDGCGC